MIPQEEYQAFMQWFEQNYGSKFKGVSGGAGLIPKNTPDIQRDQFYLQWLQMGKPGFAGGLGTFIGDLATDKANQYGLSSYLRDYLGNAYSILQTPDAELQVDVNAYNKINNTNIDVQQYRSMAQANISRVMQLYQARATDPAQYPDYAEYYMDWAKANGSLVMGDNYWESPDGRIWSYQRYKLSDAQGGGYDVVLAPVDNKTAETLWNKFAGTQGLSESDRLARERFDYQKQIDLVGLAEGNWNRQNTLFQQAQEAAIRQQQLDLQRQQFGYTQEQDKATEAYRRQQLDLQQQQLAGETSYRQQELEQRRQETLAQLKSQPQNWIQAWMFENAPAVQQAQTQAQEWVRKTSEIPDIQQRAEEQRQYFYNTYPGAQGTPVSDFASSLSSTDPDFIMAARALQTWQNKLAGAQAMANQPAPTVPANTPPTPGWLPQFVPGLVEGQPLTQQRARVSSGQQWQRTPWSQRQMLGGYLEYASPMGPPTLTDYEQMIESMLPKPQTQARWLPAYQR